MKIVFKFIVIMLLPSFVFAGAAEDLTHVLNGITTAQANFKQTIYDNHQRPIQQSSGTMMLERPGKFRWNITKPMPQLIIANQARIWVYDPDLQQVTIRQFEHVTGDAPALLLSRVDATLAKEYQVSMQQKDGVAWYKLIPNKKDSMFTAIQFGFSNNQINEMRLEDNLGHTTRITFQQMKTNLPIAASQFIFKPGKGVDVIDETRKQ